jgi:hypothetical protein
MFVGHEAGSVAAEVRKAPAVSSRAYSADFSPDGSRIVTASEDKTASIWDARVLTMLAQDLLAEACTRLAGETILTRDEMRLAGYPESTPEIDVCKR